MTTSCKEFLSRQSEHRARVRATSEEANADLVAVRDGVLSAIASHQQRVQGRPFVPEDSRMARLAIYIQGAGLSYTAIAEGLYPQAGALQRQELEAITAMEEEAQGKRRDGKTANVQNAWTHPLFKGWHGALSDLTHLGWASLVEDFANYEEAGSRGPTTIPQYRPEACRPLLFNHCLIMFHAWRQAVDLFDAVFSEKPTDEESEGIRSAADAMKAAQRTLKDIGGE